MNVEVDAGPPDVVLTLTNAEAMRLCRLLFGPVSQGEIMWVELHNSLLDALGDYVSLDNELCRQAQAV